MGNDSSKDYNLSSMDLEKLDDDHIIPAEFKKYILKEFILPYYKNNIEYVINEKTIWSRLGTVFLTTSTILIGASSILSFASGVYPNINLNFVAGSVGMVALVLKEFASYSNSVDHIKTLTINEFLKNIGIKHSINDTSRNFKKVIQDGKDTPSPFTPDIESKVDKILDIFQQYNKNKDDKNDIDNKDNKDKTEEKDNKEKKFKEFELHEVYEYKKINDDNELLQNSPNIV